MVKKIAFINGKGGCGKTTSIFHITGELVKRGKKVLVIDTDKQGNCTNSFLMNSAETKGSNVLEYFLNTKSFDEVVEHSLIVPKGKRNAVYTGIDILPATVELENQELVSSSVDVKKRINEDCENYDFVLIDCPPSNKAIETLVLEEIADKVLIPFSSDLDSVNGYGQLIETVDNARMKNFDLEICGVFFSCFNKIRSTEQELREIMVSDCSSFIDVQIPNSSAIVDSRINGKPICEYKKNSANAYIEKLVDVILERV